MDVEGGFIGDQFFLMFFLRLAEGRVYPLAQCIQDWPSGLPSLISQAYYSEPTQQA